MSTADSSGIHLAHPPMQYLSLLNQFDACLGNRLDRRVRVAAVLVEHTERLHAEVAERVFAHAADVGGRAILFGLHLNAVHELVSELRRDEYPVGIAFQCLSRQDFILVVTVTFGRVEERHAPFDGLVNQPDARLFVGRLAAVVVQSHAAEAHCRDGEGRLAAAQRALRPYRRHACRNILHARFASGQCPFGGRYLVQSRFYTHSGSRHCRQFQKSPAAHLRTDFIVLLFLHIAYLLYIHLHVAKLQRTVHPAGINSTD